MRARHGAAATGQRPWLPPLPERVPLPSAPEGLVALGLLDLPEQQRQPVLAWAAEQRPRLLILGDPGSGRTTALHAVASGLAAPVLPPSPAAVWDALERLDRPLLVDDLDHLLDRLGDAHASRAVEQLAERLRDRRAAPTVLTMRGPGAWSGLPLRALLGLADETLLLRLGLDDHLALGGRRDGWTAAAPAGRGTWAGHRAQVGLPDRPAETAAVPTPVPVGPGAHLLLTGRPLDRAAAVVAAGRRVVAPDRAEEAEAADVLVVGSPAAWQTRWPVLDRLRATLPVLVDRVPPADLRTLLGRTEPLPPVDGPDDVLLLPPEGEPVRVRLPAAPGQR